MSIFCRLCPFRFISARLKIRKLDIKILIYDSLVVSGCHKHVGWLKVSIRRAKSPVPLGKQSTSAKEGSVLISALLESGTHWFVKLRPEMRSFKHNLSFASQVVTGAQLLDKQNEIERHREHRNQIRQQTLLTERNARLIGRLSLKTRNRCLIELEV